MSEHTPLPSPPPSYGPETDWTLYLTHPRRTWQSRQRYRALSATSASLRSGLGETRDPSDRARILFELACQEMQLAEVSPSAWGDQAPGGLGRMRTDQHRSAAHVFTRLACAEVDLPNPPQVSTLSAADRSRTAPRSASFAEQIRGF